MISRAPKFSHGQCGSPLHRRNEMTEPSLQGWLVGVLGVPLSDLHPFWFLVVVIAHPGLNIHTGDSGSWLFGFFLLSQSGEMGLAEYCIPNQGHLPFYPPVKMVVSTVAVSPTALWLSASRRIIMNFWTDLDMQSPSGLRGEPRWVCWQSPDKFWAS